VVFERFVPQPSDDPLDQTLVHPAHEIALLLCERVERAVPHTQTPTFVPVWFVPGFVEDVSGRSHRALGARRSDPATLAFRPAHF
jgi:hypothetical protein